MNTFTAVMEADQLEKEPEYSRPVYAYSLQRFAAGAGKNQSTSRQDHKGRESAVSLENGR